MHDEPSTAAPPATPAETARTPPATAATGTAPRSSTRPPGDATSGTASAGAAGAVLAGGAAGAVPAGGAGRARVSIPPSLGAAAVLAGALLMGVLHLLPAGAGVDPVDDTLSEYALGSTRWLFDVSVLLVAAGSALLLAAPAVRGLVRPGGAATVLAGGWVLGLLAVVAFQKTDWSVGPSLSGTIHRYASVVAFVCAPLAVLAAARAVYPRSPGARAVTQVLAAVSLAWFGVILGAVARELAGGTPWWRAIPLGLVERSMAATEVLAVLSLAPGLIRVIDTAPATPDRLVAY